MAGGNPNLPGSQQAYPVAPSWSHGGGPAEGPNEAPSNQRYRSFAERYIIERVRNLPAGALQGDAVAFMHNLAIEARSVYKVVKEVGKTLAPND